MPIKNTHNDDDIEEVRDKIHEILSMTKAEENVIILDDGNTSVGKERRTSSRRLQTRKWK